MKPSPIACQFALLAAVGCAAAGCSGPVAPVTSTPSDSTATASVEAGQTDGANATYVSLKVPNMF